MAPESLFRPGLLGLTSDPRPGSALKHPVDRLFPHTRLAAYRRFSAPHHLIGEGLPTAQSKLRAGA